MMPVAVLVMSPAVVVIAPAARMATLLLSVAACTCISPLADSVPALVRVLLALIDRLPFVAIREPIPSAAVAAVTPRFSSWRTPMTSAPLPICAISPSWFSRVSAVMVRLRLLVCSTPALLSKLPCRLMLRSCAPVCSSEPPTLLQDAACRERLSVTMRAASVRRACCVDRPRFAATAMSLPLARMSPCNAVMLAWLALSLPCERSTLSPCSVRRSAVRVCPLNCTWPWAWMLSFCAPTNWPSASMPDAISD